MFSLVSYSKVGMLHGKRPFKMDNILYTYYIFFMFFYIKVTVIHIILYIMKYQQLKDRTYESKKKSQNTGEN